MATLQQIRAEVLLLLKETEANTHFTSSELNGFINRAQEMTAIISESANDSIEIQIEEGVGAYTLPSDNILISSAYIGDKNILNDLKPLSIYTEESLKSINPYWRNEIASSRGEPIRLLWLDRMTIFLDPRPDAASSAIGKKLVLSYIFQPASMSSDSMSPNLHLAYHPLLKFYAAYLAYISLQNKTMSDSLYKNWLSHYELIKGILSKKAEELFRFKFIYAES